MESFGERLRATRESRGISLDQAGMDTKLAIRYLQALEDENFDKFPGEAYITGFIRNYSNYLELDVNEILAMYRAIKVQEQPIPVGELLKKPSILPKIALGVAIAILLLGIAAGAYFLLGSRSAGAAPASTAPRIAIEHIMDGDVFEQRLFPGDSLLVYLGLDFAEETDHQHRIELRGFADNEVVLQTPGGPVIVDLTNSASVDFTGNGAFDLRISALDYSQGMPGMGALLLFERYAALPLATEVEVISASLAAVTGQSQSTVIFSSPNAHPFTLQANFVGSGIFRWEVLFEPARRERNERFFQRLDELTVAQVHNGVRIWASNAQAARLQVTGGGRTVPVEIGGPGEVVVADIRWIRGEDSLFRLVVARLET